MLVELALVGQNVVEPASGSKPEKSNALRPPSGHDFERSPDKWFDDKHGVHSKGSKVGILRPHCLPQFTVDDHRSRQVQQGPVEPLLS